MPPTIDFDLGLNISQAITGAESVFNSTSSVEMANNLIQLSAGLATIVTNTNPILAIAANGAAANATANKMIDDYYSNRGIKPEDAISLAGNMCAIALAAGVGLTPGGKLVTIAVLGGRLVGSTQLGVWAYGKMFGEVDPSVNTNYRASRVNGSPLVLDLDGDGVEISQLVTGAPTAILFDHNADGIRTGTAWAKADDGILALDRDGNSSIDSGRELFGDNTLLTNGQKAADGYAALRDLDSNSDGQITALDARFADLRVWRDLDQDGMSDAGELQTLAQAGITQIGLTKTTSTQSLADGTRLDGTASFTANGQSRTYTDAWFAENAFYREFTDTIPLTPAAQGVADMQGAGMVRDLREAASLDGALAAQLTALTGASRAQMMAAIDGLLETWADTSTQKTSIENAAGKGFRLDYMPPGMSVDDLLRIIGVDGGGGSGGGDMVNQAERDRLAALKTQQEHLEKLIGMLERFNGLPFVTVDNTRVTTGLNAVLETKQGPTGSVLEGCPYVFVPIGPGPVTNLEQSYAELKESVYDGLMVQIRLKPYLDQINLSIDANGIALDFSAMEAAMDARHTTDPSNALIDRIELVKYTGASLRDSGWEFMPKLRQWIGEATANGTWDAVRVSLGANYDIATTGNDFYVANSGNTSFDGGVGDDVVIGVGASENFKGGDGNDFLDGGAGNDTLTGGAGNDLLDGGAGNDYLTGGDGNDTYVFRKGSGTDTAYAYDTTVGRVETLVLEGLNVADIQLEKRSSYDLAFVIKSTGESITFQNFFSSDDYKLDAVKFADGTTWNRATLCNTFGIYGTAGNDSLSAVSGLSSRIYGDAGNDTLSGSTGNDLLDGGAGNDNLAGGAGNDILQGGADDDILTDTAGTALFNGGAGNDLILFNKGDGQDTFATGGTGSDTLSLGGAFAYSDLTFSKSTNDLVLKMGTTDQLTFKDWYAATPSKPVVNLQVIAEAMAGFAAGGANPLLDQKVEKFNFTSLVGAFDAARTATPTLTTWALTNALANFQLAGSDTAALGGDLAYQYGKNGTLAGIGLTAAQDVIGNASFGTSAQALQPLAGLQTGTVRIG